MKARHVLTHNPRLLPGALVFCALLAGCGDTARLPVTAGIGPDPELPAPHTTLLPTVNIAPAIGWPAGGTPMAAPGTQVAAFARGLDRNRNFRYLRLSDATLRVKSCASRYKSSAISYQFV